MPAPKSKAQARLFGAIAAGKVKKEGFSAAEAKRRLEGAKVAKLPERTGPTHAEKLRKKFDKLPRLSRKLPPEPAPKGAARKSTKSKSPPKKVDREAYFKQLKRKRLAKAFLKTA